MEKAGYWCGVYSFDSFFASNLSADITKRYSAWSARVENIKPVSCKNVGMWQYSWKGSVLGISGDVDLDYAYKDYPAIIKTAGLNGFTKTTQPAEPEPEPTPTPEPDSEESTLQQILKHVASLDEKL